MKPIQFYITVALAAACLILSIIVVVQGRNTQTLQAESRTLLVDVQNQQNEINRGNMSQQIGTKILQDMASVAVKNDKMKNVLSKNGYTVTVNPNPSPSPAP